MLLERRINILKKQHDTLGPETKQTSEESPQIAGFVGIEDFVHIVEGLGVCICPLIWLLVTHRKKHFILDTIYMHFPTAPDLHQITMLI
ncbi:hypothetical protein EYC80_009101 [Monilinia laxa]|uniref:Uncharacterized protein n=1 Tax=Monilinia laxa TaxID=61186 RepID=A0A5N6K2E8_MONLA|nr:hypothetical protein EYC80_009101 [Monilinia laxa]